MALIKTDFIWMNGRMVRWDDAKVHVLSHVLHYGTSWFEGLRAYETPRGPAIFRLAEHIQRLERSLRVYHTTLPYSKPELEQACVDVVRKNGLGACYIRPLVYRGYGEMGISPLQCPVEAIVAAWNMGAYFADSAVEKGVSVCVSSWSRLANNTMPVVSKAGGNYLNAQLIKMEAIRNGFDDAITCDLDGNVSEASAANLFLVQDGVLYTPPLGNSILLGLTRATVLTLAEEMKLKIVETEIPRSMIYSADELFFTGTAAEITPITSMDKLAVGDGKIGPVTSKIRERFNATVRSAEDPHGWMTYVAEYRGGSNDG